MSSESASQAGQKKGVAVLSRPQSMGRSNTAGGALAISVGDHLSMLEYATYSVASPEACASIIWRSSDEAEKAAESMKVSAKELKKISIVDEIISEPLGGAHRNYDEVSESIKNSLLKNLKSLQKLSIDKLIERRYQRLLKIGS